MTRQVLYLVIGLSAATLVFLLSFVIARRILRKRSFERLDRMRDRFRPLVQGLLDGGLAPDTEELKTPYGSMERRALEGLLLDGLDKAGPEAISRVRRCFEVHGYVGEYTERLKKGRPWERARAAEVLGTIRCPSAVPYLTDLLQDRHDDVRNMAVYSLGLIADRNALPCLVKSLIEAARGREEVSLRIAKSALIACGREAVPFLLSALGSENWRVRAALVDVLGEIGDRSAVDVLTKALDDPEPDIRAKAAKGLGRLGPPGPVERLERLTRDPHWLVRMHSVRALGLIGGAGSMDAIKQRLFDSNWQVRKEASGALGRMKELSLPLLREILLNSPDRYAGEQVAEELQRSGLADELMEDLDDRNPPARKRALEFLRGLLRRGAFSPMLTALNEKGMETRIEILRLLRGIRDRRAFEALSRAALENDYIRVRQEAANILEEFRKGSV